MKWWGDRDFDRQANDAYLEAEGITNSICPRNVADLAERLRNPDVQKRQVRRAQTEGRIRLEDETIVYDSPGDGWNLKLSDVGLIGEYTNSDGPVLGDYFFVFLTAAEGGWHQASFYADGLDVFLADLAAALGSPIETGLCNSADFKTRILWPSDIRGEPLMKMVAKPTRRGPHLDEDHRSAEY